jgi:septum formation inhibitor-activating ATPase MinD
MWRQIRLALEKAEPAIMFSTPEIQSVTNAVT